MTPGRVRDKAAKDADDYCDDNGQDAHITQTDPDRLVFTCLARITWNERMDHAVAFFRGQNARIAIERLGYPTSQREILGDTVFEWTTDRYDSLAVPTVGRTVGEIDGATYSGSTYGTAHIGVHVFCRIQLGTTADGQVKSTGWNGDERGCTPYIEAIKAP